MDINNIIKNLLEYRDEYYNTGKTKLTDIEFDSLENKLRFLDPDHPYFLKIGDSPKASPWEKASHQIPMGSLNKINTIQEFLSWVSKYPNEYFILEPKIDGLSLSMSYEKDEFVQAITRGDGAEGEVISANVRNMKGFKEKIDGSKSLRRPFTGSFRCEIILPISDLDKINSILPKQDQYENCRNAASGISRRLDGKFTKYLQLIFYDVLETDFESINEDEKIMFLRSIGFETIMYSVGDKNVIIKAFDQLAKVREELPYRIDGAVLKINSSKKQEELGSTNGRPKGQIAWKFDPPGSATTLLGVSWEVGRTGVVTPLGHCEPVEIDGSTIKNVTLHNVAEISRLGIGIGDLVMLIKAGDIIPKISSVIESKGNKIEIPTKCPSCGSSLENDGIRLFCEYEGCPTKNHSRIMNWIKTVGIDNLGESTLNMLEESGLVHCIEDLYKLKAEDFNKFEGYGEKSSNKIIQNIQKTKTLPLEKFLAGIGIPSLSTKTASDLVENFKTIEKIMNITVEDLNKIKGYSDISSNQIVNGIWNFIPEIVELLSIIKIETIETISNKGKLSGISFCFTGAMEKPRPFYQGLVQNNGGKNDSSVTKTTTYLVCNENKGSSKSQKAEKLGVKIITVPEFLALIGDIPEEEPERTDKVKTLSLFKENI